MWEVLATGNVCGVVGGRFLRDQEWNSQLKWGEPMNRKHLGNCSADHVGIFGLDTALLHTEATTGSLKTETSRNSVTNILWPQSFQPYSDPQACTDLNYGILYITTLLICSMRQKLYFIPLKHCFLPMKIPLYSAAVGEGVSLHWLLPQIAIFQRVTGQNSHWSCRPAYHRPLKREKAAWQSSSLGSKNQRLCF